MTRGSDAPNHESAPMSPGAAEPDRRARLFLTCVVLALIVTVISQVDQS